MFRRLETDTLETSLPEKWCKEFKQTLLKIYGEKCLRDDKTFEIYAFSYPDEALLIVSYCGLDPYIAPTTLFLSVDLNESAKVEKLFDTMCDSVGIFFDHYFANDISNEDIFDEYVHEWEEEELNGLKIFYKITRENIALTLEANRLLS
jgi:hypothetical protein